MKTFTLESDGSLSVSERGAQLTTFDPVTKAYVPLVDNKGAPVYGASVVTVRPEQIAAHRRDPDFEAALPADVKAALDAPRAKA